MVKQRGGRSIVRNTEDGGLSSRSVRNHRHFGVDGGDHYPGHFDRPTAVLRVAAFLCPAARIRFVSFHDTVILGESPGTSPSNFVRWPVRTMSIRA